MRDSATVKVHMASVARNVITFEKGAYFVELYIFGTPGEDESS